jgi:hypothetical protein
VDQFRCLILYSAHHFRMAMARRTDGYACVAIEKSVAIDVLDPDALRAFGNEFE